MHSINCVSYTLRSGIQLVGDQYGPANGRTVMLAHGGGQTRHAWRACGRRLSEAGYRVIAIDQRGHGDSDWADDGDYRIERFAEDLLAIADTFDTPPALVGASLGGTAGLVAQGEIAQQGERGFASLILVDITPRVSSDGVQKVLGFMSEAADTGFASLEEAADAIARYLPHRPRPENLDGLAKNLRRKENGRYHWHWDPRFVADSQRPSGSRTPQRLEAAARNVQVPALLVRGGKSELVDIEAARRFAEVVPHAEFVVIEDAGHMVAGDENDAFGDAVLNFLLRRFPR